MNQTNLKKSANSNTPNSSLDKIELSDPIVMVHSGKDADTSLKLIDSYGNPIKNAPIKAVYDKDNGILLKHNHKLWDNDCSILTDENGMIFYHIIYDCKKTLSGTVQEIKFSDNKLTEAIQQIFIQEK
ncbi:MAG: hypothetical protein J6W54_05700 [Fibrobacter sp.]|nr:hypothetical protein [Fibrobacter sp.]